MATVATRFLQALTNFQASTIDANVRTIRSYAVGDFADQVDTFFGPQTVATLRKATAKSTGHVQPVFVGSLSGGTASVFGVVNESVTNSTNTSPRSEVVRIDVQMIDTKSGWKVNRVDILRSPGTSPFATP